MAGFRSPLFLLSLASSGEVAGYRSALPLPPLGVPSEGEQAGYRGALPIPSLGAGGQEQAGYATPLPLYGIWAGDPIDPPEPEPSAIKGGGDDWYGDRYFEEKFAVILAVAQRRGYGGMFGVSNE